MIHNQALLYGSVQLEELQWEQAEFDVPIPPPLELSLSGSPAFTSDMSPTFVSDTAKACSSLAIKCWYQRPDIGIRDRTLVSETGHWYQRMDTGLSDQTSVLETRHWYQRPGIGIRDQTSVSETRHRYQRPEIGIRNWYQKPDISIREQTLCAVLWDQ